MMSDQQALSHSLIRIFARRILNSQGCRVFMRTNDVSDQTVQKRSCWCYYTHTRVNRYIKYFMPLPITFTTMPASVTSRMRVRLVIKRSGTRPPPGPATLFSWRLIMNYFPRSFSPFRWFKNADISFWQKNVHKYWLTSLKTNKNLKGWLWKQKTHYR